MWTCLQILTNGEDGLSVGHAELDRRSQFMIKFFKKKFEYDNVR